MWQVAQLTPVFFTSLKNAICPRRRSRCAVPLPNAPGNDVVATTETALAALWLTSTVATDVVNWFTTQSVFLSGAIAMPRGPLCKPTVLFVEQHATGNPSTRVGHPPQLASLVHTTPGVDVNAAHTFAPSVPTLDGKLSV